MKKAILLLMLCIFSPALFAQKTKLILGEKVDFNKIDPKVNAKSDQELKEEMNTFLGFGVSISVKGVEETVKDDNSRKKKSALRVEMGFQLPEIISTRSAQKLFKVGWDVGIVR